MRPDREPRALMPTPLDLDTLRSTLRRHGQEHLLRFHDELDPPRRAALLAQLAQIDWEALPSLVERYVKARPVFRLPPDLAPAPYYPRNPDSPARRWDRDRFARLGEGLIRAGKVAAFTVAGGQGTRLGFDGPKGCFPATPVTGKPLFAVFAEAIAATGARYGRAIPWYIMTSPMNHDATVAFFRLHAHFGLNPDDVKMFPQGTSPTFDLDTGRILLEDRGVIAANPDGHGGSITALHKSGALADMRDRGVDHISYFQVDNPLVRVVDPVFLGLHAHAEDSSGEMSSKMVVKAFPEEKLGVFCSVAGRTSVIEYSDLPMDLQRERLADGSLRFAAGSIAVHALGVEFVERVASDPAFALPFHRAEKAVAHLDPHGGARVTPQRPNAVKLERFVFDALPLCRASVVLETDRAEEFAPVKNPTGVDSAQSSKQLQVERAARWLERAGVPIPRDAAGRPDCVIELRPATALDAADLIGAAVRPNITPGSQVVW